MDRDEYDDLRLDAAFARRRHRALCDHPDPRDPDHPFDDCDDDEDHDDDD